MQEFELPPPHHAVAKGTGENKRKNIKETTQQHRRNFTLFVGIFLQKIVKFKVEQCIYRDVQG